MSGPGGTFIYISSCKVLLDEPGTRRVLDPCNCSSYYEIITTPVPGKERKVCQAGSLWDHDINQCRPSDTVLGKRLCKANTPWDRCDGLTEGLEVKIRSTCISKGYFHPHTAAKDAGISYVESLPRDTQLANIQLAIMSLVAGFIIALLVVGVWMALCRRSKSGGGVGGCLHTCFFKCLICCRCKPVGGHRPRPKPAVTAAQSNLHYDHVDDQQMESPGYQPVPPAPSYNPRPPASHANTTSNVGYSLPQPSIIAPNPRQGTPTPRQGTRPAPPGTQSQTVTSTGAKKPLPPPSANKAKNKPGGTGVYLHPT